MGVGEGAERERGRSSGISSYESNNAITRAPGLWLHRSLITSQRPCLQILSRWGSGFVAYRVPPSTTWTRLPGTSLWTLLLAMSPQCMGNGVCRGHLLHPHHLLPMCHLLWASGPTSHRHHVALLLLCPGCRRVKAWWVQLRT